MEYAIVTGTPQSKNPHVAWRLEVARQVAARLRRYEGIQAIVVGGSVARGYADAYSDLEMPLFWEALPGDALRQEMAADLGATYLYGYDGPAQEDQLLVGGFQVDFWHSTVANEETVLDEVLLGYDTDLGSSNFLDTVRACIPLYGEAIIARWKARARAYPDELAARAIEEAMARLDRGHLEVHAARGNPTMAYAAIAALQQQVFLILLALNRAYYPSLKWLYRSLEGMPVKPAQIEVRYRRAYTAPLEAAIDDTLAVVDETLALVEAHHPQIDTAPARVRLATPRRVYEGPVVLWAGEARTMDGGRRTTG
jgi:hypothetical protein